MVVKGLERNISCLYEARRLLLGLDSCEIAKVTELTSDPMLAGSGLTSYWLNMLLQQLRLSEQGEQRTYLSICEGVFHPNVMEIGCTDFQAKTFTTYLKQFFPLIKLLQIGFGLKKRECKPL